MVKQGYKQTEIGVIPEDWTVDTIDSVTLSVATGGNYKNSIQRSPYPLIKMGNLSRGHINLNKIEYVIDSVPSEKDRLSYGDVLFNTRNTPELVGKVAVWKNELPIAYFNSNLLRFNFNCEKSNPFFMNLIFNTKQVIAEFKNISKGTTSVAAIYPQDMLKVMIKIPPIQEQNRIAEALSDVDSMISSLEKLIAKKKAVKDGAMAMLLTVRKRMAGFSKEWEFFQFKDTGIEIRKGQTITQKDVKFGNIPVVAGGKTPAYYCDKYNRDGKNITISASGASAGFVNMYSGKIFASDCSTISENEKYNIVFVYNMLKFLQSDIYASQTGGAQPHIHPNDIGELYLYYTFDIDEQNAIASILSDMDNEIEALEKKLEKARCIKQGMMQQLLTGKIRLI